MTKIVTEKDFDEIVKALNNDLIVAFPTDTVFGVGVLCRSKVAAEKLKYAKKRPETKPFPVMVASLDQIEEIAYLTDRERKIIRQFTPGALTLILKKKDIIDNGLPTIAVRIPDNEFALKLLNTVGPMYVTSANISGEPACNDDAEVMQQLDGRIDYVVKGTALSKVASTIIDCTQEELKLIRQGQITMEDLKDCLQ